MKNLNIAVTDDTDEKLDEIMKAKQCKNRADAIEFLILEVYQRLFKEGGS
jgi:metal-responsive CopG/Arc/MetJ family transcriptional regulator